MSRNIYFLSIFITLFLTSCVQDDDDFIQQNNPVVNVGQVSFDGISYPITYADMYFVDVYNDGSELWALVLSENFIQPGVTLTDAYMYLEFVRPPGTSLANNYSINDPFRPILFTAYFEQVDLINGNVENYQYAVFDEEIVEGDLQVRIFQSGIHTFRVRLDTFDGFFLDADFNGLLRY